MQKYKYYLTVITAMFSCAYVSLNAAEVTPPLEQYRININKEDALKPLYWIVWEDQLKPDQRTIYEEKVLSVINKAKQRSERIRVFTFYESSTSKFYFLYPFLDMKDWNAIYSFWKEETELENIKNYLQNYGISLRQSLPELSNVPNSGQLSIKNQNYVHIDKFKILPNQENKFIELLKEWTAQTKAKAPDCGWFVQKVLVSDELPAYVIFWGDCLKSSENITQLENFLIAKQAYGTVVRRIVSEDKIFIPRLSTASVTSF